MNNRIPNKKRLQVIELFLYLKPSNSTTIIAGLVGVSVPTVCDIIDEYLNKKTVTDRDIEAIYLSKL
jgi:hypothetical protein